MVTKSQSPPRIDHPKLDVGGFINLGDRTVVGHSREQSDYAGIATEGLFIVYVVPWLTRVVIALLRIAQKSFMLLGVVGTRRSS